MCTLLTVNRGAFFLGSEGEAARCDAGERGLLVFMLVACPGTREAGPASQ